MCSSDLVSTDCPKIASVAMEYGANVIHRPAELATDKASEWDAWKHAVSYVQEKEGSFDNFLSLPATAPLRKTKDINDCLSLLKKGFDIGLTMAKANRNPWFNMVRKDSKDCINLICNDGKPKRRQDAPECYDLTTVAYAARTEFIMNNDSIWEGKVGGVEIPFERSIDIDNEIDFCIAEFLYKRNDASE